MKKNMVSVAVLFCFCLLTIQCVGSLANADEKKHRAMSFARRYGGWVCTLQLVSTNRMRIMPCQFKAKNSYAGGYDVQIAKKVADGFREKISHRPNEMGWSGSCPSIRQDRRDHRRNEPYC